MNTIRYNYNDKSVTLEQLFRAGAIVRLSHVMLTVRGGNVRSKWIADTADETGYEVPAREGKRLAEKYHVPVTA